MLLLSLKYPLNWQIEKKPATFKLSCEMLPLYLKVQIEQISFFFLIFTEIFQAKRKSKYTRHYDSPNNRADRSVSVQCFMSTVLNENILQQWQLSLHHTKYSSRTKTTSALMNHSVIKALLFLGRP